MEINIRDLKFCVNDGRELKNKNSHKVCYCCERKYAYNGKGIARIPDNEVRYSPRNGNRIPNRVASFIEKSQVQENQRGKFMKYTKFD